MQSVTSGTDEMIQHASKRALRTEKGFSMKPTPILAVAPASRLPWLVSFGKTLLESSFFPTIGTEKCGDLAITERRCVKLVKYKATPGIFLPEISYSRSET